MSETPTTLITVPEGYADWLTELKGRIRRANLASFITDR
jgi:hypothetical protein